MTCSVILTVEIQLKELTKCHGFQNRIFALIQLKFHFLLSQIWVINYGDDSFDIHNNTLKPTVNYFTS